MSAIPAPLIALFFLALLAPSLLRSLVLLAWDSFRMFLPKKALTPAARPSSSSNYKEWVAYLLEKTALFILGIVFPFVYIDSLSLIGTILVVIVAVRVSPLVGTLARRLLIGQSLQAGISSSPSKDAARRAATQLRLSYAELPALCGYTARWLIVIGLLVLLLVCVASGSGSFRIPDSGSSEAAYLRPTLTWVFGTAAVLLLVRFFLRLWLSQDKNRRLGQRQHRVQKRRFSLQIPLRGSWRYIFLQLLIYTGVFLLFADAPSSIGSGVSLSLIAVVAVFSLYQTMSWAINKRP